MRYYIKQYSETILNISELMIAQLRKEAHLTGSEVSFLDILEDFRNDLLGVREHSQKEEGFAHE